jgi:DNA repair protein RadD
MKIKLRDYQEGAVAYSIEYLQNENGKLCLELPTGAGKSIIIASIIEKYLEMYPDKRVMMATHDKELVEQNYEKIKSLLPNINTGIVSASLNKRHFGAKVVYGNYQTIANKPERIKNQFGLVIIDECHKIGYFNDKDPNVYQKLLSALGVYDGSCRMIGLTATPYRTGSGYLTDEGWIQYMENGERVGKSLPPVFDFIHKPVDIKDLIANGYLSELQNLATNGFEPDLTGVRVGIDGDYKTKELGIAVDKESYNIAVCDDMVERCQDYKSWIVFCTSISHAGHMKELLTERGVSCEIVTSKNTTDENDNAIKLFKSKQIKCVLNVDKLTTGFDAPDIDLIVMLRPTLSENLYVQMIGRGLRLKSHGKNMCSVLDYANNHGRHGSINNISPKTKGSDGTAPFVSCDNIMPNNTLCGHKFMPRIKECPKCGYVRPAPLTEKAILLSRGDFIENYVDGDKWIHKPKRFTCKPHKSKAGNECIEVTWYGHNLLSRENNIWSERESMYTEYILFQDDHFKLQGTIKRIADISKDDSILDLNRSAFLAHGSNIKWVNFLLASKEKNNGQCDYGYFHMEKKDKFNKINKRAKKI